MQISTQHRGFSPTPPAMSTPPFSIINCSWPRAAQFEAVEQLSASSWNLPRMGDAPRPILGAVGTDICWKVDWNHFFNAQLQHSTKSNRKGGEMRHFYLVFTIKIKATGHLKIWTSGTCFIRRVDRMSQIESLKCRPNYSYFFAQKDEKLEIVQCQMEGDWFWAIAIQENISDNENKILSHLAKRARERLNTPNGPVLKLFTDGQNPIRVLISLFSLIINGYAPKAIYLFGEHQWPNRMWAVCRRFCPFVKIIRSSRVLSYVSHLGSSTLLERARQNWFVMKTCANILYPPNAYCAMDDDVIVLDDLSEALVLFEDNKLVYTQDKDLSKEYLNTWRSAFRTQFTLSTGRFNAGLYWAQNPRDKRRIVKLASSVMPTIDEPHYWEQGIIAMIYRNRTTVDLDSCRYLFARIDGLPGGLLGYDYRNNPCGFKSIHFSGLLSKPSDVDALYIATRLLYR